MHARDATTLVALAIELSGCGDRTGLSVEVPRLTRDAGETADAGDAGWTSPGRPICSPGDPPAALASSVVLPFGIAVDSAYVYFTSYDKNGAVLRVLKTGGPPESILPIENYPSGIAVDDASLYVTLSGGEQILKASKDGSTWDPLASGSEPTDVAIDGARVYWTNYVDPGSVASITKAGTSKTTLAAGEESPYRIAVNATFVYWTSGGSGTVRRMAKNGGPATDLATHVDPVGITADDMNVFWVDFGAGTVMKADADGSNPVALASQGPDARPRGITADASSVYWTNSGSGSIATVARAGGTPKTLATGQSLPERIAVDSSCVYWTNTAMGTHEGSVMRAPK